MSDYHQFSNETVTARKRHKCIYCGQNIQPGEKYNREKSVYCGEFQNHAWHPECMDDQHEAARQGDTEFTPFSNERPAQLEAAA